MAVGTPKKNFQFWPTVAAGGGDALRAWAARCATFNVFGIGFMRARFRRFRPNPGMYAPVDAKEV